MAGSKEASDFQLSPMTSCCLITQSLSIQLITVSYLPCFCPKNGSISILMFVEDGSHFEFLPWPGAERLGTEMAPSLVKAE